MTIENSTMGEQPIFTCKAHVFHIDPKTKRSWIPASSSAVSVSFFYDSTRQLYRIISVEGTKAVINSTVTPNMMFTKTSQKFGQWSDMRANTVYGLGFSTEAELNKFIEKFQEVKDATRSGKSNGAVVVTGSQQVPVAPASIPTVSAGGTSSATASPLTSRAKMQDGMSEVNSITTGVDLMSVSNANDINASLLHTSYNAHQRSQSLSGLQPNAGESPKHKSCIDNKPTVDSHVQLKYENDRLKLALAQSSANAKKWEIELNSLKTTNARLTSALQESTANVEEWKKQLQTYKEENSKMKNKLIELENGGTRDMDEASQEIAMLRSRIDSLQDELATKESNVEELRMQLHRVRPDDIKESLQQISDENEHLRLDGARIQSQLEVAMASQDSQRGVIESVNMQLGDRIKDLVALHQELNHLLTT